MGQILHRSATTTEAIRRAIQHSQGSLRTLSRRHGISRLPEVEGDKPSKKRFDIYPIGFFHIDLAEVRTAEGKLYLFVAIDRTSKFAVVELAKNPICRRPLPSSKHSSKPFRIASTPCSPTTESSSRSAEEPWRAYGKMAWTSLRSHLSSS
jgi:hypothetical protein